MRAAVLAIAMLAAAGCAQSAPPTRSLDPNAPVFLAYTVAGGGQIRLTVQPRYLVGKPIAFEVDISAGTVGIRGPISAHVLQSDLGGEQTIRRFAPGELGGSDVPPGGGGHVTVTWDGKDQNGQSVKAETYSFPMDFIIGTSTQTLGTVIEVRQP